MAIIYTYPSGAVKADDLILVSEQDSVGVPTKNITVGALAAYLSGLPGGPWLPLSAGSSWPLTGDLYMAPAGSGFSVGSRNIVFRGIDDLGNELDSARIFTVDSTINPSGQDLYIQNANDVGTLTTNIFVDAFGFVGISKTNPGANLDIANDLIVGTGVTFSGYGSGTRTGTATYSLAVDANGAVIEEPLGAIPWPYNYNAGLFNLMQGTAQAPTGSGNTSHGMAALNQITTGENNTCVGRGAGNAIQGGDSNVFMGNGAGEDVQGGSNNVAIGAGALQNDSGNAADNTAVGYRALNNQFITTSGCNVAIGSLAGTSMTNGQFNVLIGGKFTGDALEDGYANVAVGHEALSAEVSGTNNTAIGHQALALSNTAAPGYNTALGYGAGQAVTAGRQNVFIGAEVASQTAVGLTGGDNVVIGYEAGNSMQAAANSNVWIGKGVARLVNSGQDSVIIGHLAGTDITGNTIGSTIVGPLAGPTARQYSTLIGHRAGYAITSSGEDNVCLGAYAGDSITDGDLNVMIGYASDPDSSTDNNSIAIGANATGAGSNTVVLGNSNITSWQPGADDTVSLGDKATRGFTRLILVSPDGTRWSVTVDNAGNLVVA